MTVALPLFADRQPWATFSPCERYRYVLAWPTGLDNDRYALFILANPSTATPAKPDPTVTRTIAYARRWGYGWSRVVNVRAWRETDPKKVPAGDIAIGPDNMFHLVEQAGDAGVIVCGWGKLGGDVGRDALWMLHANGGKPHALKLNADGSPQHPLYLRADAVPFPMESK